MPKKFAASENRRSALNMKTTIELRDRLERAAAQSGRSLTHEVEHRIERSFFDDSLSGYRALFDGDEETKMLGDSIKLAIGMLNKYYERNWKSDLEAQQAYGALITKVVDLWFTMDDGSSRKESLSKERIEEVTLGFISKTCVGLMSGDPAVQAVLEKGREIHGMGNSEINPRKDVTDIVDKS